MKRVVLIGVGGASCSGKTILAKHLSSVLPGSLLIHQDDFAPPACDIPSTGDPPVEDWDDPPTAIKWQQFREAIHSVKRNARTTHITHDHFNKLPGVTVDQAIKDHWSDRFTDEVQWVIVEGFVLYWDAAITSALDAKLLLRVPKEVLRQRREARSTYILEDGSTWTDPPGYFDQIVYPAYVKAHEHLIDGDIEQGDSQIVDILTPAEGDMTEAFTRACEIIMHLQ